MAAAYSARVRRWKVLDPGLGLVRATASMRLSISSTSIMSVSPAGWGRPCGGIMPARSF